MRSHRRQRLHRDHPACFDILLFGSIDRLGLSTAMLVTALAELEAAGVAIYADKEAVDATTPHGRAMLQMAAVFGGLERAMIRERVMAGLARAKAESTEQRRRRGKKAIRRRSSALRPRRRSVRG